MASKHATAPWYGAPEATQASLIMQSVQEEIAAPSTATQKVEFRLPTQEEISTVPLKPTVMEEPPEESLPYTVNVEEGDEGVLSVDLAPEEEQELLGDAESQEDIPLSQIPSSRVDPAAGDTRQYEYARNVQGTMESRYLISGGSSRGPTRAAAKPKSSQTSDDPSGPPPPKKPKVNK